VNFESHPVTVPNPLRFAWRSLIHQTIWEIVTHPELDPITTIQQAVAAQVPEPERNDLQALIIDELRRLHEGVLARYKLRQSDLAKWKCVHGV
jgi:hypothetical protein